MNVEAPGAEPSDREPSRADPARFPCPGCGAVLSYAAPRHPRRFCLSCLRTAADGDGRLLEFAEASMSGGLWWRRRGDVDWHQETHDLVLCMVRGLPARVREVRLGGIAAEPLAPHTALPSRNGFGGKVRIADLRHETDMPEGL